MDIRGRARRRRRGGRGRAGPGPGTIRGLDAVSSGEGASRHAAARSAARPGSRRAPQRPLPRPASAGERLDRADGDTDLLTRSSDRRRPAGDDCDGIIARLPQRQSGMRAASAMARHDDPRQEMPGRECPAARQEGLERHALTASGRSRSRRSHRGRAGPERVRSGECLGAQIAADRRGRAQRRVRGPAGGIASP